MIDDWRLGMDGWFDSQNVKWGDWLELAERKNDGKRLKATGKDSGQRTEKQRTAFSGQGRRVLSF